MDSECWLEMDLYWFQGAAISQRVEELFARLSPLWDRVPNARKGLSLCVGWLPESVLMWNGDGDDTIKCCRPPTYETWTYRRLAELVGAIQAGAEQRGLSDFHVGIMMFGGAGAKDGSPPGPRTEGWSGRTEEASQKPKYHHVGVWWRPAST